MDTATLAAISAIAVAFITGLYTRRATSATSVTKTRVDLATAMRDSDAKDALCMEAEQQVLIDIVGRRRTVRPLNANHRPYRVALLYVSLALLGLWAYADARSINPFLTPGLRIVAIGLVFAVIALIGSVVGFTVFERLDFAKVRDPTVDEALAARAARVNAAIKAVVERDLRGD